MYSIIFFFFSFIMINNMGKFSEASIRTPKSSSNSFSNNDVYVSLSTYLSTCKVKGFGLYANRSYNKGDVIQEYKGKQISVEHSNQKSRNKQYMFNVKQNNKIIFVIDAAVARTSSAARYVNSVTDFTDNDRNTEFVQYKQRIYLVATKRISKKDELISYYGEHTDQVICS